MPSSAYAGFRKSSRAGSRQCNAGVGQFHQPRTATAQRDRDLLQRDAVEVQARRLVMLRTANPAQLLPSRLFEPFHLHPIGVLEHHEHSSTRLLQTRSRADVRGKQA